MKLKPLFLSIAVIIAPLLMTPDVSAQDSLFAFVNSRRSARFAPEPVSNYKEQTARRIFDQLIEARGDYRMAPPTFTMNKGISYIAWMSPRKREVGIEEKAYDVCTQMGADSLNVLAALISHEIIHYYEKHDWAQHFINLNKDLDVSTRMAAMTRALEYETQADYLGGIFAISAGFNTYDVFPEFLRRAYQEYKLPAELNGYPSLEERIKLSEHTAQQLRKLHRVYQTANLLTLISEHAIANDYYKYILKDYQSYEVYNNAGVNATLAALQLFAPGEVPFALPLELDLSSRLDGLASKVVQDAEMQRNALLADAERWFKSAALLAQDQPVAQLNLGIVYVLKKAWVDANFYLTKSLALGEKAGNKKAAADARIALGIMAALRGEVDAARDLFSRAYPGNPSLAELNLQHIEAGVVRAVDPMPPASGVEQIDGLLLEDLLETLQVESTALSPTVLCGKQSLPHSELLLHYADQGAEYVAFHQTQPGYNGQTYRKIKLGDSRSAILAAYDRPTKALQLTRGTCLVYNEQGILFMLDDHDRLYRWVVFQKSNNTR